MSGHQHKDGWQAGPPDEDLHLPCPVPNCPLGHDLDHIALPENRFATRLASSPRGGADPERWRIVVWRWAINPNPRLAQGALAEDPPA